VKLLEKLHCIWDGVDHPFLIHDGTGLMFSEVVAQPSVDLAAVRPGDVTAVIGDFDPACILMLLRLVDLKAIIVPLTQATEADHEYFFQTACVDVVIKGGVVQRRNAPSHHPLLDELRHKCNAGLVLFSQSLSLVAPSSLPNGQNAFGMTTSNGLRATTGHW